MSVRPHPSREGWYYVDYYPDGRKGKRVREPVKGYAEAVALERALSENKTSSVSTTHPRLEQIIDEYLLWVKENQRPATYEKRIQCFKRPLPTFGTFRIRDFTQLSIDRYVSGRSKHTAHDDITSIKALAAWMKKRNLADAFPFEVEFKRPESKIKPAPDIGDINTLIDSCKKDNIRVMLQMMLYTGLRWKEVRLLRWEDYRNGEIRIDAPKTTEALIGIPGVLRQWFEDNKQPEGWIFVSYLGKPYYKLGNFFVPLRQRRGSP